MSSITPSELPTVLTAIPTVAEMNKDPIKKFTLFPKLSSGTWLQQIPGLLPTYLTDSLLELRLTIWEFALESRIIRATATHFTSEKFVRNPGMVALQLEVVKHQYGIKRVCVESSRVFDKDSASEGDKAPGVTTYSGLNFKGNKDLLLVATSQALGMLWQTDCPKQGFIQYTKTQFAGLERVGFNCHADIFETAHNHADLITTLAQFGDLKTLMFFIDQEGDLCDLGSEDELACLYRLDEKLVSSFFSQVLQYDAIHRSTNAD